MKTYRIEIENNVHWKLLQLMERLNSGLLPSLQYSEADLVASLAEDAIISRWNAEFGEDYANNHPDM